MLTGYDQLGQGTAQVIADAKTLGVTYVGTAWIPHQGPFTARTLIRRPPTLPRGARRCAPPGCDSSITCTATSFSRARTAR